MITDGPLDAAACTRLARRAGLGLARTGSTATHGSGEIFLALATGLRAPRGRRAVGDPGRGQRAQHYFAAVTEATEEAVLNSMLQAVTVTGRDGNTSYRPARRTAASAARPPAREATSPAPAGRPVIGPGRAPCPPVAARFLPGGGHGQAPGAPDPYAWMRDHDLPAMRDYLAAERAYYDQRMEPARGLREELAGELTGRMAAEESVSWRQGGHSYFTRTLPGLQFEQFCRAGVDGAAVEVLLDENLLLDDPACGGGYVALGVREVSPDGQLLAYSVDFDGDEVCQLRVRDLASGTDLAERIEGTYYELAWAADSRSFFYIVTDAVYRPYEVWLHRLGNDPARDALVFREDDERFEVTVRTTRSGAYVLIETASRVSTETLVIPAQDTRRAPAVLQERERHRIPRRSRGRAGRGEFFLVTNDGAAEFRLVRAPASARAAMRGPRSSPGRRTPGWCRARCSAGIWWWSSGAGPRPSCASWTATPASNGSSRQAARRSRWPSR